MKWSATHVHLSPLSFSDSDIIEAIVGIAMGLIGCVYFTEAIYACPITALLPICLGKRNRQHNTHMQREGTKLERYCFFRDVEEKPQLEIYLDLVPNKECEDHGVHTLGLFNHSP